MFVYRITKSKYQDNLTGEGARLYGGRWNPKGLPALYTSGSRALCILELLVHTRLGQMPPALTMLTIEIPSKFSRKIEEVDPNILHPIDWKNSIHATQAIGQHIFKENKLGIKAPSAIVEQEYNFILNPQSKNFKEIKIVQRESVHLDRRLKV